MSIDWTNLNSKDVSIAFDEFQKTLENCLDTIAPLRLIEIPTHKVWCKPWITKGISKSMDKCIRLYKQCIKNDATQDKEKNTNYIGTA